MGISAIDHLYVETRHWVASLDFWTGLGFTVAEQWGEAGRRAGRLVSSAASLVLAEHTNPGLEVSFRPDHPDLFTPGPEIEVTMPPETTGWGTHWMQVVDPDGRTFVLEAGGV